MVASAAAIMAGTGASWSPKWSGMNKRRVPEVLGLARLVGPGAGGALGGLGELGGEAELPGMCHGRHGAPTAPGLSRGRRTPGPGSPASLLEEAELGDARVGPLEQLALGADQLLRGPHESRWISPTGWNPPMAQMFPPKTTKFWPLMSAASSVARKATSWAMFSGSHSSNLPSSALAISPKRFSVMRVRARGEIALTVTP